MEDSMNQPDFVAVTKEQFYAAIYALKLNVHPRNERNVTYWEMPDRTVIGISNGYVDLAPRFYKMAPALARSVSA